MDPLTPNDPLWKLMSRARQVEVRPNFTQNVMRAARQTPQGVGWWLRVREWSVEWRRPLLVGAVAAVAALVAVLHPSQLWPGVRAPASSVAMKGAPGSPISDAEMADIAEDDFSLPLDSLDHMDALVAMEDTSSLTDAEIQFLLY